MAASQQRDGLKPVLDPTALTTLQLHRELEALKELAKSWLDVHLEKFHSIEKQFSERDTRTEQISSQSQLAINAALQAAKEMGEKQNQAFAAATLKSEAATIKQIDQINVLIQSSTKNLETQIDDLKARTGLIEGRGYGKQAGTDGGRANLAVGISIAFLVIGVISLAVSLFSRSHP